MINRLSAILLLALLVACGKTPDESGARPSNETAADAHIAARIFDMPYLIRTLDNGLQVIVVRTPYPDIINLQIPVQTGSRNEIEAGKSGFAHFFEHMMFRGTDEYSAAAYLDILKKAGAENNAFTTDDYTNYHTTFTKPDLEKMLEIEADRFQNLKYSESDFRTEALAVKGEYLKNYSNPLLKAYERIRSLGFSRHPYGHTAMGYLEDIEAMPEQIEYAQEFFDRWYRPEYTSVIVVGDVDPEQTFALVEKYWADWESGSYVAGIPPEPAPSGPKYEHISWDSETQPWLLVAFRGPAFDARAKDMPAMKLLASAYFSDSSDLYQELVIDDQFVDQLNVDFANSKDPSLLMVYTRLTDVKHAANVEAAINTAFARARTELVSAEKIGQIKSRLRYSFASQLDSSSGIGRVLADFVHFKRTPETINEAYRTFDSLNAGDIRRYANKYFSDSSRVTVTLSNTAAIAGVDGTFSIDDIVANSQKNAASVTNSIAPQPALQKEEFPAKGKPVPIDIVALKSTTSPLVDVSILIHAGAAQDPAGKKGLASLTAAMLADGGSAVYSITDINNAMYPIASGINAQVDKEMTRLSGQFHKDNLNTWYTYTRSQLLNPGWREQDFRRLQTQLINSVRSGLVGNNDEEMAKEALYSEIYSAEHPYGSLNTGHSGDIANLTLADVKQFYTDYYTRENITIGLSGGFPDSFAAQISNDLQVLPIGERNDVKLPDVAALNGNRALIIEKETPAVALSFGFPIDLTRGDPDWVALWLVRSWLGEHRSANGQLYKRIREARGMNYGDYAYIEYFPDGMFGFQPATNLARQQQIFQVWIRPLRSNNDAHFVLRTAVHEIEKLLKEGMTESDFEASRSFLATFVSLSMDGQSRQLGYAMDSRYYKIEDFAEYVRAELSQLTLEDVNRVMRRYLGTENMYHVFVTSDATDLRNRLVADTPSPIRYDAQMTDDLLQEDALIDSLELEFSAENVTVVPAERLFNK